MEALRIILTETFAGPRARPIERADRVIIAVVHGSDAAMRTAPEQQQ